MKTALAVIGGGPAGLAAAISAYEAGVRDILILERDTACGGILNQCIHNGFGLHYFGEELTGPEYAGRFIDMLKGTTIRVLSDTMVLDISSDRIIHAVNTTEGYMQIEAGAIILAMGCRERTRGAISIPGTRAAGIFTAGAAQRYVNIEGYMVGRRVVVLGSGDIGLIMSRRLTLEGAKVLACVELMPYSSGLTRNIVQCLNDYDIPLYLSHTVTDIRGKNRVEGVTVCRVDENRRPIPGSEIEFDCDTLLLSVGLIPENELSKQAGIALDPRTKGPVVFENMECSIAGVFACGNVVQVHDLVDYVSEEAQLAGRAAAEFLASGEKPEGRQITVTAGAHVTYTLPQKLRYDVMPDSLKISFRVNRSFGESRILLRSGDTDIASFKRSHMAPGEMERITLPKKLLDRISDNEITVEVKEA